MKIFLKKTNKEKTAPLSHSASWIVIAMAIILLAGTALGFVRAYFILPDQAFNSMSLSERRSISVVAVPDGDGDDKLLNRDASVYGSVTTVDGEVLFDAVDPYNMTPAFGSLLGSVNDVRCNDTRYVLNNYRGKLFGSVDYSPLTGIKGGSETVQLTLLGQLQEHVYDFMENKRVSGCCVCYDYNTGDVLCLASTPGWGAVNEDGEALEGSYINRCLYSATPGSVQKLVSLYLLEKQGFDPRKMVFACDGEYELNKKETIHCTGQHGKINGIQALGSSCNCWFAQAIQLLDIKQVKNDLMEMGISINGSEVSPMLGLPISTSSVELGDKDEWGFGNIWDLLGQNSALETPMTMLELAGNFAACPAAAKPRLTTDEGVQTSAYGGDNAAVFTHCYDLWKEAYETCYGDEYSPYVTAAKTGTADDLGASKSVNKTLCLVSEELGVAAYIVVEDYQESGVMPYEIANELLDTLAVIKGVKVK